MQHVTRGSGEQNYCCKSTFLGYGITSTTWSTFEQNATNSCDKLPQIFTRASLIDSKQLSPGVARAKLLVHNGAAHQDLFIMHSRRNIFHLCHIPLCEFLPYIPCFPFELLKGASPRVSRNREEAT